MSRRNIFELMSEKIDMKYEVWKIHNLYEEKCILVHKNEFQSSWYTIEEYADLFCLRHWMNRGTYINCEDIRKKLMILPSDIKKGLTDEQVLIYLEYILNIIELCMSNHYFRSSSNKTKSFFYLQENINLILEKLGYECKIFDDEERVLLVEKDLAATAASEIVEKELAYDIIEYNHYLLKGDIEAKRKILKALADKVEPMRSNIKNINKNLESNVFMLLNNMNIRHNNLEGKYAVAYVQGLSKEELEEWYDEIYQMLLLCILEYDNIERNTKVDELKKIIEN